MFRLKEFRKKKKLTQNDVADWFNCTQTNIAAIEKLGRDLQPEQLSVLISKYGRDEVQEYIEDENSKAKQLEIEFTKVANAVEKIAESNSELVKSNSELVKMLKEAVSNRGGRIEDEKIDRLLYKLDDFLKHSSERRVKIAG